MLQETQSSRVRLTDRFSLVKRSVSPNWYLEWRAKGQKVRKSCGTGDLEKATQVAKKHFKLGPTPKNRKRPVEVLPKMVGEFAEAKRKGFSQCIRELSGDDVFPIGFRPDFHQKTADGVVAIEVVNRKSISLEKARRYSALACNLAGKNETLTLVILDKFGFTWWRGSALHPLLATAWMSESDNDDIVPLLVESARLEAAA